METQEAISLFKNAFAPSPMPGEAVAIPSLTGAADAFLTLAVAPDCTVALAVTEGLPQADRLYDDLALLASTFPEGADVPRIYEFPPELKDDNTSLGHRMRVISALKALKADSRGTIVVAPLAAIIQGVGEDAPEPFVLRFTPGGGQTGEKTFSGLTAFLRDNGYTRVPSVEREGEYSVRGGIVDAWSPGEDDPVRADFFGEEISSMRYFNPATQISTAKAFDAEFMPCGSGKGEGAAGRSLFDLLPDGAATLFFEHAAYGEGALGAVAGSMRRFFAVYTGEPVPNGMSLAEKRTSPLPGFAELGADKAHHPELFDMARARLDKHIAAAKRRGDGVLMLDDLSGGFEIPGLLVVTKADRVFARKRISRRLAAPRRSAPGHIAYFDELEPGEYVVHLDHGVGRFIGSSEIEMDGKHYEVFTIEYADGALLHVPASHANLISRYVGVKGEKVHLHRLDGTKWEKDKEDAAKAVANLASSLLETQAKRQLAPGFAYNVECDGLAAFEAAFPFEETKDQLSAIAAVKADMAAPKPMDRLVCGDAGYGKTEVAMRAAFIAAMNGKQVAVLAPTTVLAEQHFETFTSRFDGTAIRIEPASRFQSHATREGTFSRLATGVCDIIIGTHAILSKEVKFHDLGLIIVDEEQRFGVRHKEHLKRLRAEADVLTLSATPIPRTLYLSMTGARDLSLLRTPPRERVAVDTKIVKDSDDTIRDAIMSEMARGGQTYFLHNRVATIEKVGKRIAALCPRAKITLAHGQMDAQTLAKKIREFERGRTDILLCTTIVESGIDIPRANTIIIDRADTFGLADLYQLRGRVGRSAKQGRAFLMLPPSGDADSDARERLKALQRHGGLGAGFGLALRDLELRGAGNLLGSQQSGHMAAIGFTLYCQLLQRAVAKLKGEKPKDVFDVRLNLDFIDPSPSSADSPDAVSIPYSYIDDDAQRMTMLRRFAETSELKAVKALANEMEDRFGKMPPCARRFVRIAMLRAKCAASGIDRIDVKGDRAVYYRIGARDVAHVETLPHGDFTKRINAIETGLFRVEERQG
ncbi:MAG: transcription-repair coupling factor [Kiritimatiellae bacterium]|nr:transcription-repair coupling factor [Kiritimatiellia bacterium]